MLWHVEVDSENHGTIKLISTPNTIVYHQGSSLGVTDINGELSLDLPLRGEYTLTVNGVDYKVYMPKGMSRDRYRSTGSIPNGPGRVIRSLKAVPYGLDSSMLVLVERVLTTNRTGGQVTKASGFTVNVASGIAGVSFGGSSLVIPADSISLVSVTTSGVLEVSEVLSSKVYQNTPLAIITSTSLEVGSVTNLPSETSIVSCIKSSYLGEDLILGTTERFLSVGSLYNAINTGADLKILVEIDGESVALSYPLNNYGSWSFSSKQFDDVGQKNSGMITDGHLSEYYDESISSSSTDLGIDQVVGPGDFSFYFKTSYSTSWMTSPTFRMPTVFSTVRPEILFTPVDYRVVNGYSTLSVESWSPGKKLSIGSVPNISHGVWFLHRGVVIAGGTSFSFTSDYNNSAKYQVEEVDSSNLNLGEVGGKIVIGKDEFLEIQTQNASSSTDLSSVTNVNTPYDFFTDLHGPLLYIAALPSSSTDMVSITNINTPYDFFTDSVIPQAITQVVGSSSTDLLIL